MIVSQIMTIGKSHAPISVVRIGSKRKLREKFRCLPMIAKIANALYIGSALAENKYAKRTDLSV